MPRPAAARLECELNITTLRAAGAQLPKRLLITHRRPPVAWQGRQRRRPQPGQLAGAPPPLCALPCEAAVHRTRPGGRVPAAW